MHIPGFADAVRRRGWASTSEAAVSPAAGMKVQFDRVDVPFRFVSFRFVSFRCVAAIQSAEGSRKASLGT